MENQIQDEKETILSKVRKFITRGTHVSNTFHMVILYFEQLRKIN